MGHFSNCSLCFNALSFFFFFCTSVSFSSQSGNQQGSLIVKLESNILLVSEDLHNFFIPRDMYACFQIQSRGYTESLWKFIQRKKRGVCNGEDFLQTRKIRFRPGPEPRQSGLHHCYSLLQMQPLCFVLIIAFISSLRRHVEISMLKRALWLGNFSKRSLWQVMGTRQHIFISCQVHLV